MANIINYTYLADVIIKDYGVTVSANQEIFAGKYKGKQYIHGACLTANKACEYIADDGNGNISTIRLNAGEIFEVYQMRPWKSLKIKSDIGTTYNCSFSC